MSVGLEVRTANAYSAARLLKEEVKDDEIARAIWIGAGDKYFPAKVVDEKSKEENYPDYPSIEALKIILKDKPPMDASELADLLRPDYPMRDFKAFVSSLYKAVEQGLGILVDKIWNSDKKRYEAKNIRLATTDTSDIGF